MGKDVIERFNKSLKLSKQGLSTQWDNTKTCQAFYAGDSMVWSDKIQYSDKRGRKKQALIQFNKVMPFVDAVVGFMMQNRRQIKYIARIPFAPKQEAYTAHANAVSSYVRDNANSDQLESEQDMDMVINGYGAVDTDISYIQGNATTCPNGEIIVNRLDPLCVFWDPTAKRKNLKDARWVGYWKDYDIEDALALFPDSSKAQFGDVADNDDEENYYYDPFGGRYDKVSYDNSLEWASKDEHRVRVYNFQWLTYEKYYQADNPIYLFTSPESVQLATLQLRALADEQEGFPDMFSLDPTAKVLTFDSKMKSKLVDIFGKFIVPVEFVRVRYHTAVISGRTVFRTFSSICQQDFSIQFKTGSFDARRKIWIGMVNNMMEPQLYYNKALTELMFTIASNSKGGVLVEKGAVEDIQQFEQKYASTTAVIETAEGAVSGGKIMPKGQNIPTTGLDNILMLTDQSIADASGVDKSFLGSKEGVQESGILFRRRIRQTVSTLAKYFDSISLFQKNNARLMLDYIRVWAENNEGLEIDLVGDSGKYEAAELSRSPFMCEYGVSLQESPQTPEDKEEVAEMISTIADKIAPINPAGAMKIYAVAAKSLNLDAADKQAIVEALTPQGQQIDPQEFESLKQQVQILSSETNKADVQSKLASAARAMASAELDKARREYVKADVSNKQASTVKMLEEAQKTDAETQKTELESAILKSSATQPIINV